jgi:hypothetical protein
MDNKMLKIFFFILVVLIFSLIWKNNEFFTDDKLIIEKIIKNSDIKKLKWNYLRDGSIIEINDITGKLYKMTNQNNNLEKIIKSKLVEIYGEIKINTELKNFLLFNNLINNENLPVFINESESVILQNEIKILLLTMEKSSYNKIKNLIQ